jgi:hypothetical protein
MRERVAARAASDSGSGLGALGTAELDATYEQAMPPEQSYAGLRRYLERTASGGQSVH